MERIPCSLTCIYMMLFKWRRKIENHLNSILRMSYTFPSNLHTSPIFNGASMQMESKWNTEGRQFKWSLLNTNIGTIYHKSMKRNLKRILKNILFKCKWNWFKMRFFLLRDVADSEKPRPKQLRDESNRHCDVTMTSNLKMSYVNVIVCGYW